MTTVRRISRRPSVLIPVHDHQDPTDLKENTMSSGAYALYIDQEAGSGPSGPGTVMRRVIPLPLTQNRGQINFRDGLLSLAYDNFDDGPAKVLVRVRIITDSGEARLDQEIEFPVGRTGVSQILAGDMAASFIIPADNRPAVTALVEYSD